MKSTGEVMGLDSDFGLAFAKSQEAAGNNLPRSGSVFISVKNSMRRNIIFMAKMIASMGFKIFASEGTWRVLSSNGINAKMVPKIGEGKPDIIDLIKSNAINLVINVPAGKKSQIDSKPIRSAAVSQGIPYITTLEGAGSNQWHSSTENGVFCQTIQDYTVNLHVIKTDISTI